MALKIASFMTDYGQEFKDIYCIINEYNYDAITKELLFNIMPYFSREAKENGYSPLPIPELDLGCKMTVTDSSTDMLEAGYNEIKRISNLMKDMTREEVEEQSLISDSIFEKIAKFYPYINAEDC